MTLTDYLQEIFEREVSRDDRRAVIDRILSREPIDLGDVTAAELVHEARREAGRE
ncbi:MAG: hypothetical protein IH849_00470 [Acidobacteria bacterium]|nr:hypothetical protein [Acidobacteriota bacterium]